MNNNNIDVVEQFSFKNNNFFVINSIVAWNADRTTHMLLLLIPQKKKNTAALSIWFAFPVTAVAKW